MRLGRNSAEGGIVSKSIAVRHLSGLTSVFCMMVTSPLLAAKMDVVELQNGDHITGEVKSLNRGILEFDTDHMGTLYIEWQHVARLKSDQVVEVELSSGKRSFGHLAPATAAGEFLLIADDKTPRTLAVSDTVRMSAIEESGALRKRVDGYVDFGYSKSKATDVTQYNFDAGIRFRDRIRLWDYSLSTTQSDSETIESGSASLYGEQRRFFGNRWYWSGLLQLDQNDEQGLDLRTLLGGALGRYVVQTNSQEFAFGTGLGYSREELADGESTNSVELIIGLEYDVFRFSDPELDLSTQLVVFPSLTVSGRVRAQASVRLRYELVNDLFAELTLSDSYDSKPQSVGAEKNDYTITTSIGYTF